MRNNPINQWLERVWHLSDKKLVVYVDGGLSASQSRRVKTHLDCCLQCRTRTEKMRHAISRFVERCEEAAEDSPPPRGWRRLEVILAQPIVEEARPKASWFHARAGSPRLPRLAVVLGSVLAAVIWFNLRSVPTVSAAEAIRLAVEAEVRNLPQADDQVVYQKVHLRRRAGSDVDTATVESWIAPDRDWLRPTGDDELWRELQTVLRRNGIAHNQVLSVSAYAEWRAGLVKRSDEVAPVTLPDGSEALAIKTISRDQGEADSILEAGLVVRTRDWRAMGQHLRVEGESGPKEFEITELAYNVIARSALDSSILAGERRPLPASPEPQLARPDVPAPVPITVTEERLDPLVTEVLALLALHQAGACLGEPIEVVTEAGGEVVVRGLAETDKRKQELLAALQLVPAVRIELQTVGEAMSSSAASEPHFGWESHEQPPRVLRSKTMPLVGLLPGRSETSEVNKLANMAVADVQQGVSHAWAIRRLAERFPGGRVSDMTPSSRRLLEGMYTDHARALRDAASRYRTMLEKIVSSRAAMPVPPELAWREETEEMFTTAQAAERLTFALITGSSPLEVTAGIAAGQLVGVLSELEVRARRMEASVARLSQRGLGASQAAIK